MTRETALDMLGYAAVAVGAVAAAVFLVPSFVLIWTLNTLFPSLAIPVNSYTMLAAFALLVMIKSSRSKGGVE